MFVKITTSGPRQYVKLVESFRDAAGIPRQRVIATIGRLESIQAGDADSLVNGLLRTSGKPTLTLEQKELFDSVSLPEPSTKAL